MSGAPSVVIFKNDPWSGIGIFAIVTPFCAVVNQYGCIVGCMINGIQKQKQFYNQTEGGMPDKKKGKGKLPNS